MPYRLRLCAVLVRRIIYRQDWWRYGLFGEAAANVACDAVGVTQGAKATPRHRQTASFKQIENPADDCTLANKAPDRMTIFGHHPWQLLRLREKLSEMLHGFIEICVLPVAAA